jgi:YgiT-type zinc finger domain-containing protein
MKCFICNQAETAPGKTSVVLERGHVRLTIQNVPARVCPSCGEAYAEAGVAEHLLQQADAMAKAGAKVDVMDYEGMEGS